MRRKRKVVAGSGHGLGWLVTFADMMTLLLSFFVLLLSMSSLDKSILREATSQFLGDMGLSPSKGAGRIPTRFRIVAETLENPEILLHQPQRLQDVLFPDEILPPGMSRSTLEKNLQVLLRPEGVALVLSDALVFSSGESELNDAGRILLSQCAQFLASVPTHVNIAGYTDSVPAGDKDNYSLSAERALAVLTYFLEFGYEPGRFSVSGYGDAFPLGDNGTPDGRAKNRRVEILLKTSGQTYL